MHTHVQHIIALNHFPSAVASQALTTAQYTLRSLSGTQVLLQTTSALLQWLGLFLQQSLKNGTILTACPVTQFVCAGASQGLTPRLS